MHISLIIGTYNRCEQLRRCLEALRYMKFEHDWEIVIVDNGSNDETAAVVRIFTSTDSVPVIYAFEPECGLANAHNLGISISRGKILVFTDDDCYPASDFLSRVWSEFDDPSIGYIAGRVMLHDPADYPVAINESITPRIFPARSCIGVGIVLGANMAFRRKVLLEIGGFDPLFGPGSAFNAEDVDAAARASAAGWKGKYCPEVVVRHHHGRKTSDIPYLMKSYGIGIGGFHMKLLLRGHQFLWIAQIVYWVGRRYKYDFRMVLWEPIGAAKYAYLYLIEGLRGCFGGVRRENGPWPR